MNIDNAKKLIDKNHTLCSNEAELLNALSHPARLEILELLRDGESCVCHIQAMLDHRQAYISQQLNILRQAGLITSRKEGLRVYYQDQRPRFVRVAGSGKDDPAKAGEMAAVSMRQAMSLVQKKKDL